MKWWKPDIIDIVGDIDDQLEYSTFSDGTTDEFFNQITRNHKHNERIAALIDKANDKNDLSLLHGQGDLNPLNVNPLPFIYSNAEEAKKFYLDVRKQHKNADIHASLGNHDIRVFKYMDKKAPDYLDDITPNSLWGLDDAGITWRWYHERPLERYAGIHVHHGTTSTTTGLAVKNDIDLMDISLVRGHDHRGGVVYKTYPISGRQLAGMGTGHLCDANAYGLQYADNPTWEQGFGVAHLDGDKAHLQFIPIRRTDEGLVCFLDGKKFTN